MSDFKEKTIVITGGTSGIGLATAGEFAAQGAHVIITSRKQGNIDTITGQLGGNIKGFVSDAGKTSDVWKLRKEVEKYTSHVDVLFVNAGFGKFSSLEETTEEEFDSQFNTLVKEGGSIIFNTSVITEMTMPGASVYGAAKSAVQYLVKSLANELKDRKIRVNAVSPGPIGTNFFNEAGVPEEQQQQMAGQILAQVPMNRFGEPREIAKTVLFLASGDASFITGHEIQVDGGLVQV